MSNVTFDEGLRAAYDWRNELTKALEKNDKEKVVQLGDEVFIRMTNLYKVIDDLRATKAETHEKRFEIPSFMKRGA